jgi:hypothetical protein
MWAQAAGDVSGAMTANQAMWLSLLGAVTLVVVVWIVARSYKQVQKLRLATALRQDVLKDLLARGLSPEEIERVLQGSAVTPERKDTARDHEADVAYYLNAFKLSGAALEQALALVRAADPAAKKAVRDTLGNMAGDALPEEQVLATVRGLCLPPGQPALHPKLSDEASLAETLVLLKVSGNVMEQIMEALQAADPATRKAVCQAVEAICEHEPDEGQVLATVRGLCQLRPTSAPPAAKPEPQHAFTTLEAPLGIGERGA